MILNPRKKGESTPPPPLHKILLFWYENVFLTPRNFSWSWPRGRMGYPGIIGSNENKYSKKSHYQTFESVSSLNSIDILIASFWTFLTSFCLSCCLTFSFGVSSLNLKLSLIFVWVLASLVFFRSIPESLFSIIIPREWTTLAVISALSSSLKFSMYWVNHSGGTSWDPCFVI